MVTYYLNRAFLAESNYPKQAHTFYYCNHTLTFETKWSDTTIGKEIPCPKSLYLKSLAHIDTLQTYLHYYPVRVYKGKSIVFVFDVSNDDLICRETLSWTAPSSSTSLSPPIFSSSPPISPPPLIEMAKLQLSPIVSSPSQTILSFMQELNEISTDTSQIPISLLWL